MTCATGPDHRPASRRSRPTGGRRAAVVGTAVLLAAGLAAPLGACAVRLETPAPVAPSADAAELLRDRSASQATDLAALADAAAAGADDATAAVLGRVAAASRVHADALGGVYEPFPTATGTPTPTPRPTAGSSSPAPDAAVVLQELRAAADAARDDAVAATDRQMAHLLGAIAIDRTLLADALAAVVEGAPGELGELTLPTSLPSGMDAQSAGVLVQSEDGVGMAWEVAAARLDGDARERAAQRAALHRARAQAWAEAGAIAGTGADPRRSAYDLPAPLTAPDTAQDALLAALGELEAGLGADYADLAPTLAPDARGPVLDAAVEAYRRAAGLGVSVGDLPGADSGAAS